MAAPAELAPLEPPMPSPPPSAPAVETPLCGASASEGSGARQGGEDSASDGSGARQGGADSSRAHGGAAAKSLAAVAAAASGAPERVAAAAGASSPVLVQHDIKLLDGPKCALCGGCSGDNGERLEQDGEGAHHAEGLAQLTVEAVSLWSCLHVLAAQTSGLSSLADAEARQDAGVGFSEGPGWLGPLLGPLSDRISGGGLWVHRECAVWSPEVYFRGAGLRKVQNAIRRGRSLKCSRCGRSGATMGCRIDRCIRSYHLPCARSDGCHFDHDEYLVACAEHSPFFLPQSRGALHRLTSRKERKRRLAALVAERRIAAAQALAKDVEEEEEGEKGDEDDFLRRERRRLLRDLARLTPIRLGGLGKAPSIVGQDVHLEHWKSVAGLQHVIQCMKEMVILPLRYPGVFEKLGILPPRGVLLHGHPGTGKTLVARALAGACVQGNHKVVAYFARKGADCLGKYVGDAERQLRLLFQMAEACQPSFALTMIACFCNRMGREDQTHASVVSTLLALMDGLTPRGHVVVIGATNRPDAIDPALRRPGRFDREIYFPLPSSKDRAAILGVHTRSWHPRPSKVLLAGVGQLTPGFAGADLQALCVQAAMAALRRSCSLSHLLLQAETRHPLSTAPINPPHDFAPQASSVKCAQGTPPSVSPLTTLSLPPVDTSPSPHRDAKQGPISLSQQQHPLTQVPQIEVQLEPDSSFIASPLHRRRELHGPEQEAGQAAWGNPPHYGPLLGCSDVPLASIHPLHTSMELQVESPDHQIPLQDCRLHGSQALSKPCTLTPTQQVPSDLEILVPTSSLAQQLLNTAAPHSSACVEEVAPTTLQREFCDGELDSVVKPAFDLGLTNMGQAISTPNAVSSEHATLNPPSLPDVTIRAEDWATALNDAPLPCSRRPALAVLDQVSVGPLPQHLFPAIGHGLVATLLGIYEKAPHHLPTLVVEACSKIAGSQQREDIEGNMETCLVKAGVVLPSRLKLSSKTTLLSEPSLFPEGLDKATQVSAVQDECRPEAEDAGSVYHVVTEGNGWGEYETHCDYSMHSPCTGGLQAGSLPNVMPSTGFHALISGSGCIGQHLVAAAVIQALDWNAPAHMLSIPTMVLEGGGEVALGLSNIIAEGLRSQSCLLYLPRIDTWVTQRIPAAENLHSKLVNSPSIQSKELVNDSDRDEIIATSDIPAAKLPPEICDYFNDKATAGILTDIQSPSPASEEAVLERARQEKIKCSCLSELLEPPTVDGALNMSSLWRVAAEAKKETRATAQQDAQQAGDVDWEGHLNGKAEAMETEVMPSEGEGKKQGNEANRKRRRSLGGAVGAAAHEPDSPAAQSGSSWLWGTFQKKPRGSHSRKTEAGGLQAASPAGLDAQDGEEGRQSKHAETDQPPQSIQGLSHATGACESVERSHSGDMAKAGSEVQEKKIKTPVRGAGQVPTKVVGETALQAAFKWCGLQLLKNAKLRQLRRISRKLELPILGHGMPSLNLLKTSSKRTSPAERISADGALQTDATASCVPHATPLTEQSQMRILTVKSQLDEAVLARSETSTDVDKASADDHKHHLIGKRPGVKGLALIGLFAYRGLMTRPSELAEAVGMVAKTVRAWATAGARQREGTWGEVKYLQLAAQAAELDDSVASWLYWKITGLQAGRMCRHCLATEGGAERTIRDPGEIRHTCPCGAAFDAGIIDQDQTALPWLGTPVDAPAVAQLVPRRRLDLDDVDPAIQVLTRPMCHDLSGQLVNPLRLHLLHCQEISTRLLDQ
eukprot:SM000331S12522  [mRNA]  locus=s331:72955:81881:- [translate_table: standard]